MRLTICIDRINCVTRPVAITLAISIFTWCDSDVGAQDNPAEATTLRSVMMGENAPSVGIKDRLDALIQSTQRARETRQAANQDGAAAAAAPVSGVPRTDTEEAEAHLRDEIGKLQSSLPNSARSVAEIRERIRILQRLRRDRIIYQEAQRENRLPGAVEPPVLNPQGGQVVPPRPMPPKEFPLQVPREDSVEEAVAESAGNDEMTAPRDPSADAKRILTKPVNALALGESLYRTGNFDAALKALASVDRSQLSQSDRTWLDLLVALCQRRTGDYKTAEGTLRDIANEESTDIPVQAAKWWLKHAKASNETFQKMESLSAEYRTLIERSNAHVKR